MNEFKMIFETNSGRKGIKKFSDLNEFVDFMTKNNHKIKAVMEADMPYNDKPVKLPKISQSKGWEQLDSSAFGDIDSDGEKGEQILPKSSQGVFKNNASFEVSKSSESADKTETPKIENSPVKTDNSSKSEKVSPKFSEFKYEDKSDSKENKENKENSDKDKKEEVKESIKDYLPRAGFIRSDDGDKSSQKMGAFVGQGTDNQLRKAKIIAKVKYANGDRMGRVSNEDLENFDDYYRQYKQIFGNKLNEDFKSGLKKAGKFAKGAIAGAAMAGALAGNAHSMEDPYYDGATQPDSSYEQVYEINGIEYTMPELKQIQKEQGLSDEELIDLINGDDPYADGATQPFNEAENSDEECDSCEDEQMKRIKEKHNKLKKDFADYKNKREDNKEELFEKDKENLYPHSEGWFPRWVFDTATDETLYSLINDPRSHPELIKVCKEILNDRKSSNEIDEDTVKSGSGWTNKGKEGTHGKFKTKKGADAQRKAMFANGYKVSE